MIIYFSGPLWVDLAVSLVVASLIVLGALKILWDSVSLLLDAYPKEVDEAALRSFLEEYPGVESICDLHVWGVSSQDRILTAHLVVGATSQGQGYLGPLIEKLRHDFNLTHITIQLEEGPCGACG